MLERLKAWARRVRRELTAIWLSARDPRTPRVVRWLAFAVVAYALSPIDLIPDVIPVLGLLDEAVLLPLALLLLRRLIPPDVMADARRRADSVQLGKSPLGAVLVVAAWLVGCVVFGL